MSTTTDVDERTQAARALVAHYAERCDLTYDFAHADNPTVDMAREVMAKGAELDAACEAFRLQFYPRRHRVIVGLYSVLLLSPTGRAVETVLNLFDEYVVRRPATDGEVA